MPDLGNDPFAEANPPNDPFPEPDPAPDEASEWDPADATHAWREATLARLDAWIEEEERMIAEIERWIEAAEAVTTAVGRPSSGLEASKTAVHIDEPAAQPAPEEPAKAAGAPAKQPALTSS
jgi:hypothetical protein